MERLPTDALWPANPRSKVYFKNWRCASQHGKLNLEIPWKSLKGDLINCDITNCARKSYICIYYMVVVKIIDSGIRLSWVQVLTLLCTNHKPHMCVLNRVWLFATLWAIACQVPLSMGFPSQGYWSGLLFPSAGDLPDPGIEPSFPVSSALVGEFFYHWATWEAPF